MAEEGPRSPHPSQAQGGPLNGAAAAGTPVPGSPTGGPATPPKVAPWLVAYTLGRLAIAAVLVTVLWLVGLGSFPGLLFGLLLSMPASYVLLRPVRDRLAEALAARSTQRRARKEHLRARLSGEGDATA